MAKITPFGGFRITLMKGLSFTIRSSDINKLLEPKGTKHATPPTPPTRARRERRR